ncbi:GspH/FimT family pseudopilin [Rhodoferax sp.]|uniref:GspH/FimT family pseudopilin n=1 Tax=Rhodoferax sp. TaxID=50421 RepID=UPI002841B815|nr:GspH/FimT family pseudopilin [Rhodoferax sp.]MDR3369605.1 GspH/FimT family pseudopilin [Rhodoferax sp.]
MKTLSLLEKGFTLIELLVTVALVVILMLVAVPSFTTFQRNAELTSFINSMVAAINSARGEAMKRGRYAMVVPADNTNWSSGWKAFVDMDRSRDYDATQDILVLSREAPPSYLSITANGTANDSPPYIMFDASGYATSKTSGFGNLTFSVTRDSGLPTEETRRAVISVTGRVRTCNPSTDSTCTSTATQ